jgi:hypothetical protein
MDAFKTSGSSPGQTESFPARTLKTHPRIDFSLENHGSVFLLKPLTSVAISWVEEHIGRDNGFQPYFPTIIIEHRFVEDILDGIQNDGLEVA